MFFGFDNSVSQAMPAGTPYKLAVAKMKSLIRKNLVSGCCCGCRGDFELTGKGYDLVSGKKLKTYSQYAHHLLELATGFKDSYEVSQTVWFGNCTCTISSKPYMTYVDQDGLLKQRTWLLRFLHTDQYKLFHIELVSMVLILTSEFSGELAKWETVELKNQMPIAKLLTENEVPFDFKERIYNAPSL